MNSKYVKLGVPSPYVIPGLIRGKLDESIIIKEVCKYYGKPQDFIFKKYQQNDSHVRHIAVYLMMKKLRSTLKPIAKLFNVHHSTIIYSVRLVEEQLSAKHDNLYRDDLPKIMDLIHCYKVS